MVANEALLRLFEKILVRIDHVINEARSREGLETSWRKNISCHM